jgi:hypothetical protein
VRYTKPEIAVIREAHRAVRATNPKAGMTPDHGGGFVTGSAYEADE